MRLLFNQPTLASDPTGRGRKASQVYDHQGQGVSAPGPRTKQLPITFGYSHGPWVWLLSWGLQPFWEQTETCQNWVERRKAIINCPTGAWHPKPDLCLDFPATVPISVTLVQKVWAFESSGYRTSNHFPKACTKLCSTNNDLKKKTMNL